jgi:two-component system, NarL family, nitrate/nitrite response regulator NarL
VRAGLAAALADEGVDVVAGAPSWRALREVAGDADVVVIDAATVDDVAPPDEAGDAGPARVVLLARGGAARGWLAHGVTVLPRDASGETIVAAAQAAAGGLVAAGATLLRDALRGTPGGAPPLEPLTPRECEVLQQMTQGLANRAIAQALAISEHTAKFHVAQVIAKLDASSRAHAVAKALRAGLVEL